MKFTITLLALIILTVLLPELLTAQPPGFPDNPPQAPIDGGLALLAAVGGAYALNKIRRTKK